VTRASMWVSLDCDFRFPISEIRLYTRLPRPDLGNRKSEIGF
jgi:hypothetical protein